METGFTGVPVLRQCGTELQPRPETSDGPHATVIISYVILLRFHLSLLLDLSFASFIFIWSFQPSSLLLLLTVEEDFHAFSSPRLVILATLYCPGWKNGVSAEVCKVCDVIKSQLG